MDPFPVCGRLLTIWVLFTLSVCEEILQTSKPGCEDPGNIQFGWRSPAFLKPDQRWSVESQIKFACESGYIMRGHATLTCSTNNTWQPNTPPACTTEIDYPPSSNPGQDVTVTLPLATVTLNGSESTDDKGITSYVWTLLSGPAVDLTGTHTPYLKLSKLLVGKYTFELKVTDTAGQSSQKIVHVTVVKGKECSSPPYVDNAVCSLPDDQAKSGTWAYYSCEDGTALQSPDHNRLQCISGQWVGEMPKCVSDEQESISTCPKPPRLTNGYYTVIGNWDVKQSPFIEEGTRVFYMCQKGFKMVGKPMRICQKGQWTGKPPLCTTGFQACPLPNPVENGEYKQVGGEELQSPVLEGTQIYYLCHNGYKIVNQESTSPSILTCHAGKWMGEVPSCVKRSHCEKPQDIPDGTWVFADMHSTAYEYSIGTKVMYVCDPGFLPYGASLVECLSSGYWSDYPPRCLSQKMYCEDPGQVVNGYYVCRPNHCGMFKVGTQAHFVCEPGYEPVGNVVLTCLEGGEWSMSKPACYSASTTPLSAGLVDINSSTMTVVIATSCSVLGLLLLVMVVVALRRRKPSTRLCHPVQPPSPTYARPRSDSLEQHDRVALMAFADGIQVVLPTYEEAVRGHSGLSSRSSSESAYSLRRGISSDYRPLPSIPPSLRGPRDSMRSAGQPAREHAQDHHRNSIITTASTATRDNLSQAFGSIDTMNVSDGTSTSVTIETYDSAASNPSIATSHRATAGSLGSSNSLATEDAPLLDQGSHGSPGDQENLILGNSNQNESSPTEEEKQAD